MHYVRSIRRIAVGAALAGAAVGLVPAAASAGIPKQPTCTYNDGTRQVTVFDKSDIFELELIVQNGRIAARTPGFGATVECFSTTGSGLTAGILNTDKIVVSGKLADLTTGGQPGDPPRPVVNDGYTIDLSKGEFGPGFTRETDGNSEIEISFVTGGVSPRLKVIGTEQADDIRVGGPGFVNFGIDNDVDVEPQSGARDVTVNGLGGADFITATGNSLQHTLDRTAHPVIFDGGSGPDTIIGGDGKDQLSGGIDSDYIHSSDGVKDVVAGGPGLIDVALTDVLDTPTTGLEQNAVQPIGTMKLSPRALRARAGKPTRLNMSWTHPKAWRELRSVELQLYDDGNRVGSVIARPRGLQARGAVKVMAGSRVTHQGKTVTARLALRLPRSLAGENLRVAVQATDRRGQRQLQPDAGAIRVAK